MKTRLLALLLLLPFFSIGQQYKLITATEDQITLDIQVPDFHVQAVATPQGEAFVVTAHKALNTAQAGEPNLPMLVFPTVVGDDALMQVQVLASEYTDYENMEIAPSKGDFPRSINPEDVPYTYGEAYQHDAFFPSDLARLDEPYIHRDVRGQNLVVYPYTYNPVTKVLRVYTRLVVRMDRVGKDTRNVISNRSKSFSLDPEFKALYQHRYVNFQESMSRYNAIEENGELLVICHDAFMTAMEPFVAWKKQIGRPTTIVSTAEAGSTSAAIKSYIETFYAAHPAMTDILLVGDVAQIPGIYISAGSGWSNYSGYGDAQYGQLAGNDYYNEVLVGRFCCETEAQVTNHVNKVLNYERDLDETATWLSVGQGVSKNEGAGNGHNGGEADYEHIDNIRNDLLNYNYTEVHRDYQGVTGVSSSAAVISQHINAGVSIINYCNHGNVTSWGVFSYSNSHVNALTNDYKLPYIISVACLNGKYDNSGPCFAEAWMRATNNSTGNPTGAIGGMFSYIEQPWTPPQDGQDEMVDILVELQANNIKHTMGGVSINGNMKVLDLGVSNNANKGTYNTWILFGDPTLTLRNAIPTVMTVSAPTQISAGATSFDLTATDADGALATLSFNGEIMGSATIQNGAAAINFSAPGTPGTATLTVFGYNKKTFISSIEITSGSITYPEPPTNVTATVNSHNVTISWTAASPADSYKVYRDNVMIAQGITTTSYTDSNLDNGTYNYTVATTYQGYTSTPSAPTSATVLTISVNATAVPNVIPLGESATLNASVTGGTGIATYSWSPAGTLNNPNIMSPVATPTETTVYTVTVTQNGMTETGTVTVHVLVPPTDLIATVTDENDIVLNWNAPALATYYTIYRDGEDLISSVVPTTYTVTDNEPGTYNFEVAAFYRGVLSPMSNVVTVTIEETTCPAPENFTGTYYWNEDEFGAILAWDMAEYEYTLDRFEIYRSTEGENFKQVGRVVNTPSITHYEFTNVVGDIGNYTYRIIAFYQNGCESEPEDVEITVTSVDEQGLGDIKLYPNPTSGNVSIIAEGMQQIQVVNLMGQVLITQKVDADEITLDLGSFDKGMYMVIVTTGQGSIVKKINVLK